VNHSALIETVARRC